jgi:hypothetical protein
VQLIKNKSRQLGIFGTKLVLSGGNYADVGKYDESSGGGRQPAPVSAIAADAAEAIAQRLLQPDDALPPERKLAADLSVSRLTVRKALDGLVAEGLLVRRPGSGNFINHTRIEQNFSRLSSFSEDMGARPASAQRMAAPQRGHGDAG